MSEKITQMVKASVLDEQDTNEYRVVGMTSESGFFAYVEYRPKHNPSAFWLTDENANQYQVWESDTPDFMSPVDLHTDEHARDWFSGQGYELDTESLTTCCGSEYIWLTCDECELDDEPHDYAICDNCGADIDD
jgi:hypothetical protein